MSKQKFVAEPGTAAIPKTFVNQVRRLIQDYPEVNELVEGEETSDQAIARFIQDVIDDWNYTPPVFRGAALLTGPTLTATAAAGEKKWILDMAAARVMKSIVFKLARNDMPYTAGNVTIQPNAVWRNLQPIVQEMEQIYEQRKKERKVAQNLDRGWGVSHTDLYVGVLNDRDGYLFIEL